MKRLLSLFSTVTLFTTSFCFCHPITSKTTTCSIDVCETPEDVADRAASIFIQEINKAKALEKRPIFILPTGGTAIPFYNKLVEYWNEGKVDLSNVETFNLDEYVGLHKDDPNSYNYFMRHYFFDLVSQELTFEVLNHFGLMRISKEDLNHSHLKEVHPLDLNHALDLFKQDLISNLSSSFENTYASVLDTVKRIDNALKRDNPSFRLVSNYLLNDKKLPSLTTLAASILHHFNLRDHAILKEKVHIPRALIEDETAYKQSIREYIKAFETAKRDLKTRLVTFCGIGVDPAHIAFNDFLCEKEFLQEDATEEELTELALNTKFRLVPLTEETRRVNARFFDYSLDSVPKEAVTMGFGEIIDSDRIILMAFGVNKAKALYRTFAAKKPTYKVPSSLLRFAKACKPELIVDKKAFGIDTLDKESLAQMLHNTDETEIKDLFALKGEIQNFFEFADVISHEKPSCILNEKNAFTKEDINLVKLPENKTILWIAKSKDHDSQLLQKLKKKNNVIKVIYKNFQTIDSAIDETKPEYLYLPEFFKKKTNHRKLANIIQKHSLKNNVIGIYYAENYYKKNLSLPLVHETLERKVESLKKFHVSQVKRAAFDKVVYSLAQLIPICIDDKQYSSESFYMRKYQVQKNGSVALKAISNSIFALRDLPIIKLPKSTKKLQFGADDIVIAVAPHPDDAEIGLGGLIHESSKQNIRTVILNVTEGSRAAMCKSDLINSATLPGHLLEAIQNYPKEQIQDENLKKEIRASESTLALEYLHPRSEVYFLNLPFYHSKGYEFGNKDKKIVDESLDRILSQTDGNIYIFIPRKRDEHLAHKQTTRLFTERVRSYFKAHSDKSIYLASYTTPWTGEWNLYLYNEKQGSELAAITGSERLLKKGAKGYLPKFLGGKLAERYFLSRIDKVKKGAR